jgi:hypothetical protein
MWERGCVEVLNVVPEELTLLGLGQCLDVDLFDLKGPEDELGALGSSVRLHEGQASMAFKDKCRASGQREIASHWFHRCQ